MRRSGLRHLGGVLVLTASFAGRAHEAALDVAWGTDGLATGRLAHLEVRAERPIVDLAGSLGDHRVVAVPRAHDHRTWSALVPVAVEAAPGSASLVLEAIFDDDARAGWSGPVPLVAAPYDERQLRVDKKFVTLAPADALRAEHEGRALAEVLARWTAPALWCGSFVRPAAGVETSPFGTLRTYNDARRSRHLGLDLDGAVGDPIIAANRGRVALAADRFYSGGTVVLDHGEGLFTLYFHMSRIDVGPGQLVDAGTLLGAVGATGQVTGPHLHFTVKLGGESLDPHHVLLLDLRGEPPPPDADICPVDVHARCGTAGGW